MSIVIRHHHTIQKDEPMAAKRKAKAVKAAPKKTSGVKAKKK